jgi:hypothetical protein
MPVDPERVGGEVLQDLLLLTGVSVPGAGYVPIGLGFGFACPQGEMLCYDVSRTDPVVRSQYACDEGQVMSWWCPWDFPATLSDGHVLLQHASPHSGLEGYPQVMVALALPHRVRSDALDYRGAGLLVHRAPVRGTESAFADLAYPAFPELPAAALGAAYPFAADDSFDVHWLIVGDAPDTVPGVRWEIFAPADSDFTFVVPQPPAGFPDPFSPVSGEVVVRHSGLRLEAGAGEPGLSELVERGELAHGRLFDHVTGFATRRAVLVP